VLSATLAEEVTTDFDDPLDTLDSLEDWIALLKVEDSITEEDAPWIMFCDPPFIRDSKLATMVLLVLPDISAEVVASMPELLLLTPVDPVEASMALYTPPETFTSPEAADTIMEEFLISEFIEAIAAELVKLSAVSPEVDSRVEVLELERLEPLEETSVLLLLLSPVDPVVATTAL
jgi:hypothetical protein